MAKNKTSASVALRVLKLLKKYIPLLIISVILAAVSSVLSLYVPILFGKAIDSIVGAGKVDFDTVIKFLTRAGIIGIAVALMQWIMSVINNKITFQTVRDVREAAFRKIEELPLSYIDSHPHGDLVSRVISDVDTFADGLLLGFSQFFTGIVTIVATLCFMLTISWKITLVAVVLTPMSLFMARYISKNTYDLFGKQSKIRGEQTALIDEMIGNQKTVGLKMCIA